MKKTFILIAALLVLSPLVLAWAVDVISTSQINNVSTAQYDFTTDATTGVATGYTDGNLYGRTCFVEYIPDASAQLDNTFTVKVYRVGKVKNADGNLATVSSGTGLTGGAFSVATPSAGNMSWGYYTVSTAPVAGPLKVVVTEAASGTASSGHVRLSTMP